MQSFQLQIITPAKTVFDDQIQSLIVPGEDGSLGVQAHHAALVASLGVGKVTIIKDAAETTYRIDGGFIEVRDNVATLLVDQLVA